MASVRARLASFLIAIATALTIVALVLPLFLNPVFVAFEQDRSAAQAWTGFSAADLRTATDGILSDLVVGPPDFDVEVGGAPVLDERERSHMRDVRGVFMGFFAAAILAAALAVVLVVRRRRSGRAASWRSVRAGAIGLVVALVVVGGVAFVAFDALFEAFHVIFFPGGTYTFDPATERLVQLFPFQFWQETAVAVGLVAAVVAIGVAAIAGRAIRRAGRAGVSGPAT